MKTVKYQVRWDWRDRALDVRHEGASDWIVSVNSADGLKKARAVKNDMLLQEDYLSDHGIEIGNLRIVKCTEEVIA